MSLSRVSARSTLALGPARLPNAAARRSRIPQNAARISSRFGKTRVSERGLSQWRPGLTAQKVPREYASRTPRSTLVSGA